MSKPYVRLDKNDAAVLLVDHQTGLLSLVRDIDPDKFKNNVLAVADIAQYFNLPTILTTSFEDGPNGPLVPELKALFPDAPYIARPGQINAWDNEDFVKAVKATGKKQLIIAGAVLVPLFLITIMSMPKPAPVATPTAAGTTAATPEAHPSSEKATALAVKSAGFKVLAIPEHWYEDTSEISKPNDSFGVYSERANQKIICTEFADLSPVSNLSAFIGKPPYADMTIEDTRECVVDQGKQVLGEGTLNWMVVKGKDKDGKDKTVLVASFPSIIAGKSFLVVGQALKTDTGNLSYDAKGAVSIIDQLASERTQQANNKNAEPDDEGDPEDENAKEASDVELKAFYAQVKDAIKEKLVLPDFAQEEMKKEKSKRKKWKIRLTVGVDADGNVKRLEKQALEDEDKEKISSALQRAVSAAAPFKDVPHIKKPELIFLVKLTGDKVKVDMPEGDSGL